MERNGKEWIFLWPGIGVDGASWTCWFPKSKLFLPLEAGPSGKFPSVPCLALPKASHCPHLLQQCSLCHPILPWSRRSCHSPRDGPEGHSYTKEAQPCRPPESLWSQAKEGSLTGPTTHPHDCRPSATAARPVAPGQTCSWPCMLLLPEPCCAAQLLEIFRK